MEITREIIEENINNPEILEDLYQSNKKTFSEIIKTMHEPEASLIIKYWYTRLFYKPAIKTADTDDAISSLKKSNTNKYLFTALLVILTWIPIRLLFIDTLSSFKENIYLIKSIPIIFSVTLSLFFLFDSIKFKNIALSMLPNIIVLIYIVLLEYIKSSQPNKDESQSFLNAFIFMFILLWFFILFTYSNFNIRKLNYSSFLEKCGETIIWSTIFLIGGIVIYGLSLALFNSIGIDADNFYDKNIVPLGIVASPFVSLLVIEYFNKVKISVIVANIFLPLILISLVAFGITSIFTEVKPYEDRDIFILYNVMMVIVISVLVFTGSNGITNKIINICSYILPVVTVILDFITISAVIYRLSKYGITPNKITLLGTNIVMLGHLVYMIYLKFKHKIEQNTLYLPLYFLWAFIVVFIFPFIFKMA
jgi:hypothetical protein